MIKVCPDCIETMSDEAYQSLGFVVLKDGKGNMQPLVLHDQVCDQCGVKVEMVAIGDGK